MKLTIATLAGATVGITLASALTRHWWPGFLHWLFSRGDQ